MNIEFVVLSAVEFLETAKCLKSHVICGGHSSGKLCRHGINVCMCGYPKLQPAALDTILEEQESASLGARASG